MFGWKSWCLFNVNVKTGISSISDMKIAACRLWTFSWVSVCVHMCFWVRQRFTEKSFKSRIYFSLYIMHLHIRIHTFRFTIQCRFKIWRLGILAGIDNYSFFWICASLYETDGLIFCSKKSKHSLVPSQICHRQIHSWSKL